MKQNDDRLNKLLIRLNILLDKQATFSKEIQILREDVRRLQNEKNQPTATPEVVKPQVEEKLEERSVEPTPQPIATPERKENIHASTAPIKKASAPKKKSDLEKFIGENLINKIGIGITIIGVAIGAKYAIDHQLISPLARILLGYIIGIGLLVFAVKLKKNYHNFSAVLLSGAMTIMYFITYAAYDFYGMLPQYLTFGMMVLLTIFTVFASLNYNEIVIAHIGLVGAYAVPFLLSDGSGRVQVLFSYMGIINIGILIIGFKRNWKSLYYSAFALTWLIFGIWYAADYDIDVHFGLAMFFSTLFFLIFYGTFLGFKLLAEEKFAIDDIIILLINSFIFYAIGYGMLSEHETGQHLLGLFTLLNAVVHFVVSVILYRKKSVDHELFRLVAGLVLVFLTVSIPVQLDGNWVTLLWIGEAALLFWIGRTKQVSIYEGLAYPLIGLAFFSLLQDWMLGYSYYGKDATADHITPIFNQLFLTSSLFLVALGWINKVNSSSSPSPIKMDQHLLGFFNLLLPSLLLLVLFVAFYLEIDNYWVQRFMNSELMVTSENISYEYAIYNKDIRYFNIISKCIYSMLFFIGLNFINLKKVKNDFLGNASALFTLLSMLFFLFVGLYDLGELRMRYLKDIDGLYYAKGSINLWLRYLCFVVYSGALYSLFRFSKISKVKNPVMVFDLVLHISLLWVLSSELINWMDMAESTQSYKLGLSIFWGIYALLLIILGINKKKKHLRIAAISWFGITLLKLFFYDISHLNTISKTIVFVSLGILLLIISFLYNKYKHVIANDDEV